MPKKKTPVQSVLQMAEAAAAEDAKFPEEEDFESALSSDDDTVDPDRDTLLQALVDLGVSLNIAEGFGYMFSSTLTSPDLSQAQSASITLAKTAKVSKDGSRTALGKSLSADRLNYDLLERLSAYHDKTFPNGNFAALVSLSPEGMLQFRGVPMPTASFQAGAAFKVRVKSTGGSASVAERPRSIFNLYSKIPSHLMSNKLTSRSKHEYDLDVYEAIGHLTEFHFQRLLTQAVTLPNQVSCHLELLHVEQKFLLEEIKAIAEIAQESLIDWAPKLEQYLRELDLHQYDDLRSPPTILSRWAASIKSLFITDGVMAFEFLGSCFKEDIVCKDDNTKIATFYAFEYDPKLSATANLSALDKLRESTRRSVLHMYQSLLEDKFTVSIFLGNFYQPELFSASHDVIAVQTLRSFYLANPALLDDWPRLRVEIEKLQQGPCFRGHLGAGTEAAAFSAHGVQPKIKPPKHIPKPAPRPTAAAGAPAAAAGSATPRSDVPAPTVKFVPPGNQAHTQGVATKILTPAQLLQRYYEMLTKVRDFFAVANVPLDQFLEPVSVRGKPTHRWILDKHNKTRPKFIPPVLLNTAKLLEKEKTCTGVCEALYFVKESRVSTSPYFIVDIHEHARVMMSITGDEAPRERVPADYFALLEADTAAASLQSRADAVGALSAGLGNLHVQDDDQDDGISAVTDSTLNFGDVFAGGVQVTPEIADVGAAGGTSRRWGKQNKKKKSQTPLQDAPSAAAAALGRP